MRAFFPLFDLFRSNTISENERIASVLARDATAGPMQVDFLEAEISEWLTSKKYSDINLGNRYYENDNDIVDRVRTVIGRDGNLIEAPYLANNRLPHSFLRKLTKQKIGYLLSKPFTITSENEEFQNLFTEYFDDSFISLFKNCAKEAIVTSIGWIQVYYDSEGNLKFLRIPSTEIIPFWGDVDHTNLVAAIRIYEKVVYSGKKKELVQYVKFFTEDVIFNYVRTEDGLIPNPDAPYEYNFNIERASNDPSLEGTVLENVMWGKIPLIPVKYNTEEDSLLKYIKPLIDDYDLHTSELSNTLEDEPNKIKIVRNYEGTDKGEFMYNLAKFRTLFLRSDGDVSTLDTSISTEALENHLTRIRKDIYEFGGGVDTQNKELGDTSGKALKFIYADLDMDCNDFGIELSTSLKSLMWFIKQDLLLKGRGDFLDAPFKVVFNTDIVINESETINNLVSSVGILSHKTILSQHPYVEDVTQEEEQIKIEEGERISLLEEELKITSGIEIPDIHSASPEE